MHILESFATTCGLQIEKPYIYESYMPLPTQVKRYISFQPYSRQDYDAKNYDHWRDVIDILRPVLNKEKIAMIQVGGKNEPKLGGCLHMNGQCSYGQTGYIIKNSILHLGADSVCTHIASHFGKKIVALYSNLKPSHSKPYWSDEEDVSLISALEEGEPPSLAQFEEPKTINRIKPEHIAGEVCSLLGLDLDYPFKTLFTGKEYRDTLNRIESACESVVSNVSDFEVDSLIARMDINFSEEKLIKQLNICKCSVVTDKPIGLNIVRALKDKMTELVYIVDKKTDVNYIQALKQTGVNLLLMSRCTDKEFNKIKLKYLDIGYILNVQKISKRQALKKIGVKNSNNLYYKSYCCLIRGDRLKNNLAKNSENIPNHKTINPLPVIDDRSFWNDLDRMMILEKTS